MNAFKKIIILAFNALLVTGGALGLKNYKDQNYNSQIAKADPIANTMQPTVSEKTPTPNVPQAQPETAPVQNTATPASTPAPIVTKPIVTKPAVVVPVATPAKSTPKTTTTKTSIPKASTASTSTPSPTPTPAPAPAKKTKTS